MNNTLLFIRHSLPDIQPHVPPSQWQLSTEGKRRCGKLAERLSRYQPFTLYSSPEIKAIQTAQGIQERLPVKLHIIEGLEEHKRLPDHNFDRKIFERDITSFFAHPTQLVFGAETADQAFGRFTRAVDQVILQSRLNPAVVSHGTVISLFISRRCDLDVYQFWTNLTLPCFAVLTLPGFQLVELVDCTK